MVPLVHHRSPPEAKIALFRSLFRGREDVYPRRFEGRKTGKAGYSPACANEWVRGVCEKPRVKCAECPQRRFLPVTDEVIGWHLSGHDDDGRDFVMGVYPMLQDESCFFLAADFDKTHWLEDAEAARQTSRGLNLPVALERSRSGSGGHLWWFFAEAIPAALARRLGSHLLTETMERRPDIQPAPTRPLGRGAAGADGRPDDQNYIKPLPTRKQKGPPDFAVPAVVRFGSCDYAVFRRRRCHAQAISPIAARPAQATREEGSGTVPPTPPPEPSPELSYAK